MCKGMNQPSRFVIQVYVLVIKLVSLGCIVILGSEQPWGSGSTIRGGGVFEMQITPKVIAPKKFRENPRKTKKTPKKLRTLPKNQENPSKTQEPPPKKKNRRKICFSFGGQNLGGSKSCSGGGVPVLVNRGGGGSVIASCSTKITMLGCNLTLLIDLDAVLAHVLRVCTAA